MLRLTTFEPMKKTSLYVLILIGISAFLTSCDNTLNILDNYRETPIVYGLLNKNDSAHFIRIQKRTDGIHSCNCKWQPEKFKT